MLTARQWQEFSETPIWRAIQQYLSATLEVMHVALEDAQNRNLEELCILKGRCLQLRELYTLPTVMAKELELKEKAHDY